MNTRKKTWVNSMFSQLSHLENNSPKPKKSKDDTSNPSKRTTRKKSTTIQPAEEIIDLDAEDECKNDGSTFLERTTKTNVQISNENWIDVFAPSNSEELAIHPKKVQEIQQWFQHCAAMRRKNPAQLCLLTGPSGSGKTAAVRILAKENKINIQEWINPVDQEMVYNLGDQVYGQSFVSSQVDAFKNFLFKASRYRSLLETIATDKRLLMVEDFPNFLLRDPTVFQEILEDYANYAKSPLIFIVTDAKTRGLNISYNLFTDQIKQKFLINHISFNAIASTIMQKAMKRFCNLMRSPPHCEIYKSPPSDIIDSIVISAQGDIRNALINLHFSSLKGAPGLLTKRIEIAEESKTSRKRKGQNTLKSVGRDESVTMMHALGRVFNPKFTEDKHFVHSPEELAEAFTTEPKKFIDLVQANYVLHFRDIEYVLEAANGLSLCDIMLSDYRDDSLALTGLNVGIRSVMVANTNPATGWMPIKGQKRIDPNTVKIPLQASKVLPEHHNISSSLYALDYKTFVNIISP
ncbi:cell cycle checkpoint protein RAD17 [Lucilia sericata]|uniref:cell cycle checkpoint protein RAD17 n=1 Tax=Lucilia sericata TaxID=13632 RepID=UPI0018A7EE01|nr:cell cycle checkpoint protein RAD17 [Lucilia sericata]